MRFDVSALVVIALFVWIGHRRGLLLTAVGFISSLMSIAIAFLLVRPMSGWLFKLGLFSGSMKDMSDQIHDSAGSAPSAISPVLENLGLPETWTRKILQESGPTGNSIIDTTVNSVWQLVLGALALIVIFVIVRVAIGLVARLLTPVLNGIPVIGWLNRTGGLFLGLLWGVFTIWIIVMVLISFSLTSEVVRSFMDNSRILAYLAEKDIFRSLLDTIF
ncbi:MAG TPA: CvpA family protein [Clostridia bacterium]|nr:CvpA family protein [Clostridia bacterium]